MCRVHSAHKPMSRYTLQHMKPLQDAFDFTQSVTIRPGEQPELFRLAVAAVSDGNGTFTYEDTRWAVGVIEAEKLLEIYPEK